jgi:2-keto-4-pentenoate hydratase
MRRSSKVLSRADKAARILWRARTKGQRIEGLPDELLPRTLAQGYAIQKAFVARIGHQTGWKLSAAGPASRQRLGIDHCLIGRLTSDRATPNGGRLSMRELYLPVVEPEFGFEIGRSVDVTKHQLADADILGGVSTVRLALEIPDAHYRERDSLTHAPTIVADNAWAGHYVVGPAVPEWRRLNLTSSTAAIVKNGAVAEIGSGAFVIGGPVAAFLWLARALGEMGETLEPGQVVITGTCTPVVKVVAGDRIVADFGSLGTLSVAFDV